MRKILVLIICLFISNINFSQVFSGETSKPLVKTYTIGGIEVVGVNNVDKQALILISGLNVGDQISVPGDQISNAIKQLWKQQLFSDIKILESNIVEDKIFLTIQVKELKRLSRFSFEGITKSEADDLREDLNLYKERLITDHLINSSIHTIRSFMRDKGYYNCQVFVKQVNDSLFRNHNFITFIIHKNPKIKIDAIQIEGNQALSDEKIKKQMKETKERSVFAPFHGLAPFVWSVVQSTWKKDTVAFVHKAKQHFSDRIKINIFKSSKYLDGNLDQDKSLIIEKYNALGYRDAEITFDTVYSSSYDGITIVVKIYEGRPYYFRNITWIGNSIYSTRLLNNILDIKKGDIYNQELLNQRLFMNQNSTDVSSLYMDNGYLFFQINPVEVLAENDSIDLELRVYEGKQARIKNVTVIGNTKTNDHVILREIRTKPGQLFSRTDIIRTQRELATLGYFNPEKLNVNPKPNPADGTVDVEYIVEEKPSDQLELSAGWGGRMLVGTLGLTFNNFSTKNIKNKNAWTPLPAGDGQRLSVRIQSTGQFFQGYSFSFTEPWMGGKKPQSFSVSAWHNRQSQGLKYIRSRSNPSEDSLDVNGDRILNPNRSSLYVSSISFSLGSRLKKPDDYFTFIRELTFQHYQMNNWIYFIYQNGTANNVYAKFTLSRNSIDQPIYPRKGAQVSSSLQFTLPYSYINSTFLSKEINYEQLSPSEKYKWTEYYKIKFSVDWYTELLDKLVLRTKLGFGFLNSYNNQIGSPPFERFYLGGSGLTNFNLDAREIIALRGYDDNAVFSFDKKANSPFVNTGQPYISKYTMELRYPVSLNPQATIFFLAFTEAGNTWHRFNEYDPFDVRRSVGFGIRAFLPMFGMLGLDWGHRLDDIDTAPGMQKSQIHFTIGTNLGEL